MSRYVAPCREAAAVETAGVPAPPPFSVDRPSTLPSLEALGYWGEINIRIIPHVFHMSQSPGLATQAQVLHDFLSVLRRHRFPLIPFFRDLDLANIPTLIDKEPCLGTAAEDLHKYLINDMPLEFQATLRRLVVYFCYNGNFPGSPSSGIDDSYDTSDSIASPTPIYDSLPPMHDDVDCVDAQSLPFRNLKHRYKLEETAQWADFAIPVIYLCGPGLAAEGNLEDQVLVVQGIIDRLRNHESSSTPYFDRLTADELRVLLSHDPAFSSAVQNLISVSRSGLSSAKQVDEFRQALRPIVNHLCTRPKNSRRVRFAIEND